MDDMDELTELSAHLFSARQIVLAMATRLEQRQQTRQRVARHRMNKPTTHTQSDDPARERRIA